MPTLLELAEKYHSDKLYWHSYVPKYEELFKGMQVKRLLEIGIGYKDLMQPFLPPGVEYVHGSSLKMWKDYFPKAHIYGCDIRQDAIFNEERISTMVCDQSIPFSLGLLAGGFGPYFDVIIDDGSHLFEHQLSTAQHLIFCAEKLYIIEDVWPDHGKALAERFGGEFWAGEKGRDDNLVIIRK